MIGVISLVLNTGVVVGWSLLCFPLLPEKVGRSAVPVFVVVGLTCAEVGLVPAGQSVRSPSVGYQQFIHKCIDQ